MSLQYVLQGRRAPSYDRIASLNWRRCFAERRFDRGKGPCELEFFRLR